MACRDPHARGLVARSGGPATIPHLRQCRLEIATVAVGAHPALRAFEPFQILGGDQQKLVRLAALASHADLEGVAGPVANATRASVRHPHAITRSKPCGHAPSHGASWIPHRPRTSP